MRGMNLQVIDPSRKRILQGDVFVMKVSENQYIFGRVIRSGSEVKLIEGAMLVYIYGTVFSDKNVVPFLDKENLLVPPLLIARTPWSKGYFVTVEHKPLNEQDILPVHCFEGSSRPPRYFNEFGFQLPFRVDPCGHLALTLLGGINDCVCEALGIPVAEID